MVALGRGDDDWVWCKFWYYRAMRWRFCFPVALVIRACVCPPCHMWLSSRHARLS